MKQRFFITFMENRKDVVMHILRNHLKDLERPSILGSDTYMAMIEATPGEWREIRRHLTASKEHIEETREHRPLDETASHNILQETVGRWYDGSERNTQIAQSKNGHDKCTLALA